SDHEQLITRTKDLFDNATPSGNSLAAWALVRLAKLTGRESYSASVESTLRTGLAVLDRSPTAAAQLLLAIDIYLGATSEIVIVDAPTVANTREILGELHRRFLPNKVVALRANPQSGTELLEPLFTGKQPLGTEPTL